MSARKAPPPAELEAIVRRTPPRHALVTRVEAAGVLGCGVASFDSLHVPPIEVSGRVQLYLWEDVLEALRRRKGKREPLRKVS